jgi:putative ABC transport system permease protein
MYGPRGELLKQDLRYVLRSFARTPGFVVVTLLTLMLGIGANLAIFGVVHAVILRPLPIREPDRVVRIFDDLTGAGARDAGMSVPEMQDIEKSGVFSQVSAMWPFNAALGGADHVERIEMLGTSPNYFELLGVKPALGRAYTQKDWVPGFTESIVISDALWRRQFGGDPAVLGRSIRIDMDPYTIIGVMPPDFRHPGPTSSAADVDVWAAAGFQANPFASPPVRARRMLPGAIGRLQSGASIEDAQTRLNVLATTLSQTYPEYPKDMGWKLRVESIQTALTGSVRSTLVTLLVAVGFVLLIVCANVASLFLARSSTRTREFAIRRALGASGARLMGQLITESLVLSFAGGLLALGVLALARPALVSMIPPDIPRLTEIHTDWTLAIAAVALSIVTGVLFGVAPAIQASKGDLTVGLKDGGNGAGLGRRSQRSRSALVVAEVALSVVLLAAAGLLIRSFERAVGADAGLDPRDLIAAQIWVPIPNNPAMNPYRDVPSRTGLVANLLSRMSVIPGVQYAALGTLGAMPSTTTSFNPAQFSLPDEPNTQEQNRAARFSAVSADYFHVLGTPIRKGRAFTQHDDSTSAQVVIVNEAFVRRFSSAKDPVGRIIRLGRAPQTSDVEIVGVSANIQNTRLDLPPEPQVYFSMLQRPATNLAVLLRTKLDVSSARVNLSRAVRDVDAELPVFNVRTVADMMSASIARRRFSLFLMTTFAASALLLAALGVYGVVAFSVNQRKQEFGVRAALGARPRDILTVAVKPGIALAAIGAGGGLIAAFIATQLMKAMLFGVTPSDPVTFVVVPALLLLVAGVACVLPGRRATRVSPIRALRGET